MLSNKDSFITLTTLSCGGNLNFRYASAVTQRQSSLSTKRRGIELFFVSTWGESEYWESQIHWLNSAPSCSRNQGYWYASAVAQNQASPTAKRGVSNSFVCIPEAIPNTEDNRLVGRSTVLLRPKGTPSKHDHPSQPPSLTNSEVLNLSRRVYLKRFLMQSKTLFVPSQCACGGNQHKVNDHPPALHELIAGHRTLMILNAK